MNSRFFVDRPVFAAVISIIIVIGVIGLVSDVLFKWVNRRLYPWAQLGR